MKAKNTMLVALLAASLAGACPAMAEDAAMQEVQAPVVQAPAAQAQDVPAAAAGAAKDARAAAAVAAASAETDRCRMDSRKMEDRIEADVLAMRSELSKLTARAFLLANVLRQRQGMPEIPAETLESWRQHAAESGDNLPGSMGGISEPGLRSELYSLWSAFNQVLEATVRR